MIGALYNGLSGLNSEQKALGNESNNIANVNTVGYKSSRISFADLMYQTDIGKGVKTIDPIKQYEQGTLKQTGNSYDFAIKGDGFFEVTSDIDPTTRYYTRAGNLQRASDGLLKNGQGMNILGVNSVVTGDNITANYTKFVGSAVIINDTQIKSINTYTTDITNSVKESGTSGDNLKTKTATLNDYEALSMAYNNALYKNSQNPIDGEAATKQSDIVTFGTLAGDNDSADISQSDNIDLSIKIDGMVYTQSYVDSMEKTLQKFSDKISSIEGITSSVDTTTGALTINSMISGKKVIIENPTLNEKKVDLTNLTEAAGDGQALIDALYTDLKTLVEANGGKIATNISTITKASTNSLPASNTIQLDLSTLNMDQNSIGELEYDNGIIYMKSGKAKYAIAQLTTVNFKSNTGLDPKGDNLYSKTAESGDPLYIKGTNEVVNRSLELSTANLADGLVNLMVFQKAFEANSKSVTTSDEFLQTAIQMKK